MVEIFRRFRGACSFHYQDADDRDSSQIPEDSRLHTRGRENLKYHPKIFLSRSGLYWRRVGAMTYCYEHGNGLVGAVTYGNFLSR